MNQLDNQAFGHVKQSVMRNNQLSLEAKSIYAYLSSFAGNESGECFPSLETILAELNISKNRFYKYIKELEEVGIIERKKRKNASTLYKIINHVIVSAKEKVEALTTKKEDAQTDEKSELPQNKASELLQIEAHNNNTINNNTNFTNKTIDSRQKAKNDKQLYLNRFNALMPTDTKELIAQYALDDDCNFNFSTALRIEKTIFGAKKTATEELMQEQYLDHADLTDNRYYELNLHTVNLTETLNNIFYQLRKDRHHHKIKNPKIYLFGALKKMMKEWIKLDYQSKNAPKIPMNIAWN